jgi:chromosome segregation ATPase
MSEVDSTAQPVSVRFPTPKIGGVPLTLPRGRRLSPPVRRSEEVHKGILARPMPDVAAPPLPVPVPRPVEPPSEAEQALRALEARIEQRERELADQEAWLAEREREVAENTALVAAREAMLAAAAKSPGGLRRVPTPEEQEAYDHMREEMDRREASLRELRAGLEERERFLDESESRLLRNAQLWQEKEAEVEQREEELKARERRIRQREAAFDPAVASALEVENAAARPRERAE